MAFYRYETVLSFGAPVANKYKIMVDNVGSMLFDTNMVSGRVVGMGVCTFIYFYYFIYVYFIFACEVPSYSPHRCLKLQSS